MRLIGRKREKRELEQCERSTKSELVCVYGRRRVGKTYLIEQTFGEYFAFRAVGLERGSTADQLRAFHQRLIECGDGSRKTPGNWFEAFSRLDALLTGGKVVLSPHNKKIVFFDEFPWFATKRSDFLLAFEDFWNRRGAGRGDILFIICGSATSWIIKNVLDDIGSLYNRVTAQIFIKPFTLAETESYFNGSDFDWSREQMMEFQMVFGGLPFFMSLMNSNESFMQNVDRLLFKPNALLRDETKRLLEATLKVSPVYGQILKELSLHRYGMKKAACRERTDISTGTFIRACEDLIKCGYVMEYNNKYERGNPLYLQIYDPFLLFHYHYINGKKRISSYGELRSDTGGFFNWRGHAFELLCFCHIDRIKDSLGISGVVTDCFPWYNEGAQIDLVIERADKITNICEMKCTDKPYVMKREDELSLIDKCDVFREASSARHTLRVVLISANGISGVAHTNSISQLITLDDLFE